MAGNQIGVKAGERDQVICTALIQISGNFFLIPDEGDNIRGDEACEIDDFMLVKISDGANIMNRQQCILGKILLDPLRCPHHLTFDPVDIRGVLGGGDYTEENA
jgi:hypothetical protein